jgi:hypothetical protein
MPMVSCFPLLSVATRRCRACTKRGSGAGVIHSSAGLGGTEPWRVLSPGLTCGRNIRCVRLVDYLAESRAASVPRRAPPPHPLYLRRKKATGGSSRVNPPSRNTARQPSDTLTMGWLRSPSMASVCPPSESEAP